MPSKMEAPESAKTITVFVNGDSNYSGKKFVVNRKRTPTFDTLLGDVSTFGHKRYLIFKKYREISTDKMIFPHSLNRNQTYLVFHTR